MSTLWGGFTNLIKKFFGDKNTVDDHRLSAFKYIAGLQMKYHLMSTVTQIQPEVVVYEMSRLGKMIFSE